MAPLGEWAMRSHRTELSDQGPFPQKSAPVAIPD